LPSLSRRNAAWPYQVTRTAMGTSFPHVEWKVRLPFV
jgi:hypothetical protein